MYRWLWAGRSRDLAEEYICEMDGTRVFLRVCGISHRNEHTVHARRKHAHADLAPAPDDDGDGDHTRCGTFAAPAPHGEDNAAAAVCRA